MLPKCYYFTHHHCRRRHVGDVGGGPKRLQRRRHGAGGRDGENRFCAEPSHVSKVVMNC